MSTIKYKTIQESWDTFNGVVLDKMKELHHILTIYESAIFSKIGAHYKYSTMGSSISLKPSKMMV